MTKAYSTHLMGGEITYQCVGTNQYKVRLSLYRDCNGVNLPSTSQTLSYRRNAPCTPTTVTNFNVAFVGKTDITPICASANSRCSVATGVYGIERFIYEGTVTIPAGCSNWTFTFQQAARNNVVTTLNNPGGQDLFLEARVNNTVTPCNSNPVYSNAPTAMVCRNQPYVYNQGAVDPDGDSLVFSLVAPKRALNTNVTYNAGYSALSPFGASAPVTINSATGEVSFTPINVQVAVLAVLVKEYRNGVLVGESTRDIQVNVLNCNNTAPVSTGIDSTNVDSIAVCGGAKVCFFTKISDVNAANKVTVTYVNSLLGAIVTIDSNITNKPTLNICWTSAVSDSGLKTLIINMQDDA
ncbi:MAG: hypothetical protein KA797_08855, partial [Chitinophagales bacterium]|nr:hypothetical protein [Chitinophagales bacterium]